MSKKSIDVIRQNVIWNLAYTLVLGTIVIAPYFRGLFFPENQMVALMVVSGGFLATWIWKTTQREFSVLPTWMDKLVFLFLVSYVIPLILGPADLELGFIEFSKTILFAMVFWSVANLAFNKKRVVFTLRLLYFGGVAVSIVALIAAVGLIFVRDGFLGTRLFSSLQYPNTAAALFLAAVFLGMYFKEKDSLPYVYIPSQALLMLAFFGTKSRGGLLTWIAVVALFYLFVPSSKRTSYLSTTLITSIPAYLFFNSFLTACANGNTSTAILMLLLTVSSSIAMHWLANRIILWPVYKKIDPRLVLAIQTLLLILLLFQAVFGFSFLEEEASMLKPQAAYATTETVDQEPIVVSEDRDISMSSYSAYSRLYWMREAIEQIFVKHPLFGYGGGAWEASYKSFQSYDYNSTQVHSSWIQILVETGLFGFLSFCGIWLMLILYGFSLWKKGNDEQKLLVSAIVVSAMALGGHAFIDFDFSISSVMLFLFALFGLMRSLYQIDTQSVGRFLTPKQTAKWRFPVLALVLILTLGTTYIGYAYKQALSEAKAAVSAIKDKDNDLAMVHFENCVGHWPLKTDCLLDLATLHMAREERDEASEYLNQAERISPYNPKVSEGMMKLAWTNEEYDKVMLYAQQAVDKGPWNMKYRAIQSDMYILVSLRLIQETVVSDTDYRPEIKGYLEQARDYLEIFEGMRSIRQSLVDTTSLRIDPVDNPVNTINNAGAAAYLLGEYDKADELLQHALDEKKEDSVTYFWLSLTALHQGEQDLSFEYRTLMKEKDNGNRNFNEDTIDRYINMPSFWDADLDK